MHFQRDIDMERHRLEARKYLPKSDDQYATDMESDNDAYTSDWFLRCISVMALGTVVIAVLQFSGVL